MRTFVLSVESVNTPARLLRREIDDLDLFVAGIGEVDVLPVEGQRDPRDADLRLDRVLHLHRRFVEHQHVAGVRPDLKRAGSA
jgi:hypothetical protein